MTGEDICLCCTKGTPVKKHRCSQGIKDQLGRRGGSGWWVRQSDTQTKGAGEKPPRWETLELRLITEAPEAGMQSHIWARSHLAVQTARELVNGGGERAANNTRVAGERKALATALSPRNNGR